MSRIDDSRPFHAVRIAILTVSDTRTATDDTSGNSLVKMLTEAGHELADRAIEKDDIAAIRARVAGWIANPGVDVVITTGGTGFTGRDVTPEAITPLFEKHVDGFSPTSSACRARRAPARTPGTASSSGSSTTATAPAISSRSCRG